MDWSPIDSAESDLEGAVKCFNENLRAAIDSIAPLKTVQPKDKSPPWAGPELKLLIARCRAAKRRYRRTGRTSSLNEFLRLSQEVEERAAQERNNFLHNHLADALDTNKNIWKEMRNLGLLPKSKEEELHGFTPDELNAHFAGVSISPHENTRVAEEVVSLADDTGFSFKPTNEVDVILAVKHFSSQARGVDGIPQTVIAKALPTISDIIVKIFNSSFAQGVFPEAWKKAQLIALKKSTAPSALSDFRPIALLYFLSKVLEKIAHDQLMEYLKEKGLLDSLQTGFRQHNSTQTALLKLTDDIRMAKDKKMVTLLLLFDFSKAFDTISPSKMLQKLRPLGFSRTALLWIKSYLEGRSQMVTSQNSGDSDWLKTNLGVPQGSVLGPLLFSLYVNDLPDILGGMPVKHLFYADDLQIYLHVEKENVLEGIAQLEEASRLVADWAESSGLRLNAGKTKSIFFGSARNVNELREMDLAGVGMPGGVTIPFSDTVVSLGVTLDSKLEWESQIDQVAKKVNRALYGLRFIRACTTETLRRRLVETLVQPYLDYCTVVYLDADETQRTRLQRLNNSCVRYIFGVRRDEHITPYRERLCWLRLDSRRLYFAAILIYKAIRMKEPEYLAAMFTKYQHRCTSRSDERDLNIPRVRLKATEYSFQYRGARLWNSLPPLLRSSPSLSSFKLALKSHFFMLDSRGSPIIPDVLE